MSNKQFVHLRTHSQYSVVDGLIDPTELVKMAADDKQPAIALTDLHRMFGIISFYSSARKEGVKPIIGADVWIDPDVTQNIDAGPVRLLLICQNEQGYRKLMELISKSYLDNQRNGLARIKQSWLNDTTGLIALSGDQITGEIGREWMKGDVLLSQQAIDFYKSKFKDRFFIEIQRVGREKEEKWIESAINLANKNKLPVVATHPIQFLNRDDFFAHEVKVCIGEGTHIDNEDREVKFTREQHFMNQNEMVELFSDIPGAIENSVLIAQKCSSEIKLGKSFLPDFPTPNNEPLGEYFKQDARHGLQERLEFLFKDKAEFEKNKKTYQERLEFELDVIEKMGFAGYFMVVSDFIKWAKNNDIPVGPGRGSGAGSLVAYSLKITEIDPIKYGLLFERFLNPDRVSMPDFDIDFDGHRRDEVIDYVGKKYGDNCVAQIATYGTMKAKAAIRDAGRALHLPYPMVDGIAKMIPGGPKNLEITIEQAIEKEPKLKQRIETDKNVKRLVSVSQKIEGLTKSVGKHAGGVIIAPGKLTDFTPLYIVSDGSGVISQYDKDDVEKAGLVKFDFLGLNNLTVIQKAIQFINKKTEFKNKPFDINLIPIDDKKVFNSLGEGDALGVFQFESAGMRRLLSSAKPDSIEDLIALVSLYRPGPMGSGMDREWVNRKHGLSPITYPHPKLEEVLKPTYGVIVYQEQVMQIAQILAGYTLGGADLLRRAMGKKKPEEMAKERSKFEKGCGENGIDPHTATHIFDMMEKFAEYGFNKSHAAAYAMISYQTSYLKTNYPEQYYSALLNVMADGSNQTKIDLYIKDARNHGLKLLPPDINMGEAHFVPVDGGILYGLSGLKGVSEGTITAIVEAREKFGKFTSLIDFCEKVGKRVANKTVCEALVRAGAFDSIEPNRAALFEYISSVHKYIDKLTKQKIKNNEVTVLPDLFGDGAKKKPRKPKTTKEIDIPLFNNDVHWSMIEKLNQEKLAVGFYLSGHPFDGYLNEIRGLPFATKLADVDKQQPSPEKLHFVAGVISNVKTHITSNGKKMAFVSLDDGEQEKDITVFNFTYEKCENLLKPGNFIAFEAIIEEDYRNFKAEGEEEEHEASMSMKAERAYGFDDLKVKLAEEAHIALLPSELNKLKELQEKFKPVTNEQPKIDIVVYMPSKENSDKVLKTKIPDFSIAKTEQAINTIENVFSERLKIKYQRNWYFEPKQPKFKNKK
jgi:DNA polymerase III subunit alpha